MIYITKKKINNREFTAREAKPTLPDRAALAHRSKIVFYRSLPLFDSRRRILKPGGITSPDIYTRAHASREEMHALELYVYTACPRVRPLRHIILYRSDDVNEPSVAFVSIKRPP